MHKSPYQFSRSAFLVITILSLLASCKKDVQVKTFKARTQTLYRVVPIQKPIPLMVNGTEKLGFSYFPGAGTGIATGLGECVTYFNQLVYSTTGHLPPEGSVGAPVADVPGYPVTGGPLPLIQPGEQEELASIISALKIPSKIHDQVLNQIFVNERGDAIFLSAISGTSSTFPISQTVIGFEGRARIIGGRGKLSHATGEVDYYGSFSVIDPNDAEYNADGWIVY